MIPVNYQRRLLPLLILFSIVITSCGGVGNQTPTGTATTVPPTRTPFPPSPTPIPTAAVVNDEAITLAEFQEELARYQAAVGRDLTDEDSEIVIQNLIDLTLLAQAARTEGFQVSDQELENRFEALNGTDGSLQDWLAEYGYTENSFRAALKKSIAAAWMRDEILNDVPLEMEQIRAQQILFYEQAQAQSVLDTLNSGAAFGTQAAQYDPQTKGELGWFPRGYLILSELDDILFELEAGEMTGIIETEIGYHIIKVIDKSENRPLDPAVYQVIQQQSLEDWLARRRKLSTITITLPQ